MYVSGRTTKAPREGFAVRNADAFGDIYGPLFTSEEDWVRPVEASLDLSQLPHKWRIKMDKERFRSCYFCPDSRGKIESFTISEFVNNHNRRPMKRFAPLITVALILAVAFPLTAQAQTESSSGFEIGPRVTIDVGDIEEFALGGDVRYDLSQNVEAPVQLSGAIDFYFADDAQVGNQEVDRSIYTVDLNAHYMFPTEETFSPYAGAGIGITGSEVGGTSSTDTGLNLVGGVEFDTGTLQPFVQGQITIGDFDRLGITGGLLFAL
jgi:hypothetical protein